MVVRKLSTFCPLSYSVSSAHKMACGHWLALLDIAVIDDWLQSVVARSRRRRDGPHEPACGWPTIRVAVPVQVTQQLALAREVAGPDLPRRLYLRDTRHTGVANAVAALTAGVSTMDASIGGAGGCPFAPAATGNVATEDLVYLFERSGVPTGLDLAETVAAAGWLEERLATRLPSALLRAGGFPPDQAE